MKVMLEIGPLRFHTLADGTQHPIV